MSDLHITISGTKRLLTKDKYCDKNIVVTAEGGGGYDEGYNDAQAAAEAHNAEILADCNAVLPTKGVETAETLEQVPQRIGEIVQEENLMQYLIYAQIAGLGVFDNEEVVLTLDRVVGLNRFSYIGGTTPPYSYTNTKVKRLVLNCKLPIYNTQQMLLTTDTILERVTLNADVSKSTTFFGMFSSQQALKVIDGTPLDLSSSTNNGNILNMSSNVEEIRFAPNTIKVSIGLQGSSKLSNTTIQSIIDGLAEVATAQTLTLHADVGAKLTQTQKDVITAKNWTLVY